MGRHQKGAFVNFGVTGGAPAVIVFQYNPETLTRYLARAALQDGSAASEPARERISFTMSLDAIDLAQKDEPRIAAFGLLPIISALEMLADSDLQTWVLFLWGPRSVPVRVTGLVFKETEFSETLTPVRADVEVVLDVVAADAESPPALREVWLEHLDKRKRFADLWLEASSTLPSGLEGGAK